MWVEIRKDEWEWGSTPPAGWILVTSCAQWPPLSPDDQCKDTALHTALVVQARLCLSLLHSHLLPLLCPCPGAVFPEPAWKRVQERPPLWFSHTTISHPSIIPLCILWLSSLSWSH